MAGRLAIVGSRRFADLAAVRAFVARLKSDTVVISGGAPGVDSVAAHAARARGLDVIVYKAEWDRHGRRAGMLRNARIAGCVDGVAAFWDGSSRGTADMIRRAREKGVWLRVYRA